MIDRTAADIEALRGPFTEQASALRDEGWTWPDIAVELGVEIDTLVEWVGEREPILVELDARDLRIRHRRREELWAMLLDKFDHDADLPGQLSLEISRDARQEARTLSAAERKRARDAAEQKMARSRVTFREKTPA